MNLKYSVYIVMLLYSNESFVNANKVYNINDEVLSCSGWLSTIIFQFCNNTYKIVKRDTSVMIEKMAPKDLQIETSKQRLVDESHWRRVRRQVATECCLNPCTVADIIMYCPDDAKLFEDQPDIFD
ncbi:hypothetical protein PYW07_001579 [Mythimna separata]|uniref:Insulin-like domain-containing protein n=1 Tax=Mythimna separata TaxID=271217 RepID=A0AAD8DW04_MYTSE|nr:hypothetical protein PYW07_001579 [Mythimna separata]